MRLTSQLIADQYTYVLCAQASARGTRMAGFSLFAAHVFVCDSFVIHGIQGGVGFICRFLRRTNANIIAILQKHIFLHETTKWQIYFDLMHG